jgi:hypothetical protein
LEQLLASQRNLDNRVERSTLTIQLQCEAPLTEVATTEDDPADGIADAWRSGWDAFVGALFAIGLVIAVTAPFVISGAVVLGVVWLATRRFRRRQPDDRRAKGAPNSAPAPDHDLAGDVTPDEQLAGPSPRG